MSPRRRQRSSNLLEERPVRNLEWETGEDGRAVLLVPRFRGRLTARWLLPRLARPAMRVRLDARGTFVWTRLDGETTLLEIAEKMSHSYGEAIEPVIERIARFVTLLARDRFLLLSPDRSAG